jgi:hypothetical protein
MKREHDSFNTYKDETSMIHFKNENSLFEFHLTY